MFDLNKGQTRFYLEQQYNFPTKNLINIEKQLKTILQIPEDFIVNNELGWMISYAEEGYICELHADQGPPTHSKDSDLYHTRLNVMISKPEKGGDPIIMKEEVNLRRERSTFPYVIEREENEPWVCVAGIFAHSTVEVKGKKPRILISLGYNLSKKFLRDKGYIIDENIRTI